MIDQNLNNNNDNQTIIKEEKNTIVNEEKEEKEEPEYKAPQEPNYEDPNQIYEDSTEESRNFKRLNGELESKQSSIEKEAEKSENLDHFVKDYSALDSLYFDPYLGI